MYHPNNLTTAREVLARTGVTYRQLEHWCTLGYVSGVPTTPGSGNARVYTPDAVAVLTRMGALVWLGMRPALAARVAHQLLTTSTVRLDGFTLTAAEVTP